MTRVVLHTYRQGLRGIQDLQAFTAQIRLSQAFLAGSDPAEYGMGQNECIRTRQTHPADRKAWLCPNEALWAGQAFAASEPQSWREPPRRRCAASVRSLFTSQHPKKTEQERGLCPAGPLVAGI